MLVGHVLANLQSYLVGDPSEQAANFANFGPVPDHCCEPTNGGCRSYFDIDPHTDPWSLPPLRSKKNVADEHGEEEEEGEGDANRKLDG